MFGRGCIFTYLPNAMCLIFSTILKLPHFAAAARLQKISKEPPSRGLLTPFPPYSINHVKFRSVII